MWNVENRSKRRNEKNLNDRMKIPMKSIKVLPAITNDQIYTKLFEEYSILFLWFPSSPQRYKISHISTGFLCMCHCDLKIKIKNSGNKFQ